MDTRCGVLEKESGVRAKNRQSLLQVATAFRTWPEELLFFLPLSGQGLVLADEQQAWVSRQELSFPELDVVRMRQPSSLAALAALAASAASAGSAASSSVAKASAVAVVSESMPSWTS